MIRSSSCVWMSRNSPPHLGVSGTPVREVVSVLEQEGFIRTIPRRGINIVRKSKREKLIGSGRNM